MSLALATVNPYFLNTFWQIPDGLQILGGHFPKTVAYAISSGPLVSQEWLYEAGLAWFVQHGAYGAFVLLCALAAAATPPLVYAVARAFGAADPAAGAAAFLVVGARFAASAVRAETFAVDLFAIELLLLAKPRFGWWILPCVAVWANVHASVIFAPVTALLFASATALAQREIDASARRLFGITALAAAATLATPYGLQLWSYTLQLTLAASPARANLEVWKPLSFGVAGAVTAVLPGLLVLAACGLVVRRLYAGEIAIAALCFLLTLTHARYAVFLVVGWAPAIARTLQERLDRSALVSRPLAAPAFALIPVALYAGFASFPVLRAPAQPVGPWQSAASLVATNHLSGNTYAPYDWAAFLHWRGLPVRLLIDAHGDPYPADVWNDHLALRDLRANWRDVLARRHIAVVLARRDSALAQALLSDSAWTSYSARDGAVMAFARVKPSATSATAR